MNTNKNLAKDLIDEIKKYVKDVYDKDLENIDNYNLIYDLTNEKKTFAVVTFHGKLVHVVLHKHTEDIELELQKSFKVEVSEEKLSTDIPCISKYINKVCSEVWLDNWGISKLFNELGEYTK